MLTPCISCRRPVAVGTGGRCASCTHPGRKARQTWAWQQLSRQVRATGRCTRCGRQLPPDQLEAGHIVAATRAPGMALDPRNVEAVCGSCNPRGPRQR